MTLQALIFDVDGTLADTEETHRQAFNAAFIEFELWWDWSPERYTKLLAVSGGKERLLHYIDTLRVPRGERERLRALVPALHRTKTRLYTELLARGQRPLRPGVARLLLEASAAGVRLAIASTTTSVNVDALLQANRERLPGVRFEAIVCADQVAKKKPSPRIYDLVLSMLRLPASACIAFEDSVNGLRAAKGAGLATIVTPTRWSAAEDFSSAERILDSLENLRLSDVNEIHGEAHAAA